MKHILSFLLFLCWALAVGAAFVKAQVPDSGFDSDRLRFRQLSTANGLSQNFVQDIVQDRQGYMWFGTQGGLNRYDGYTFEVFKHDPHDHTSLSGNVISELLVDRDGYLWVTNNNSLDRLDPHSGIVERLARWAEPLLEDRYGTLWVRDGEWRLHRLQYSPSEAARLEPVAMIPGKTMAACEDRQGDLWFAARYEGTRFLYRYDPVQDRITAYPVPVSIGEVLELHPGHADQIWVAASNYLGVFDAATGAYTVIAEGNYRLHPIPDVDLQFWAVSHVDISVLDARAHTLRARPGAPLQYLPTRAVVDRTGGVWIGTILGGVFYHSPFAAPFFNLARQTDTPLDLASEIVMGLHEAADSTLWVGTLGGGLYHLNAEFEILRHYPYDPSSSCSKTAWDVHEDQAGRLWLGMDDKLCLVDAHTGDLRLVWSSPDENHTIEAIREDTGGVLWLALFNGGFGQYDPTTQQYRHMGSGSVHTLHLDRTGLVWLKASGPAALLRFDPTTETFTRYPYPTGSARGTRGRELWDIHEDEQGALWLATTLGLSRFDPATETFRHYTEHDGLPASTVFSILPDDEGRLWLGTTHGLAVFDPVAPPERAFTTYDATDGLLNAEFNRRSAIELRRGAFLFGGTQGLTLFDPASIHPGPHAPPVVLQQFEKRGRDGVETIVPGGQDVLVMGPHDRTFHFTFAALDYATPGRTRYAYKLDGFDDDWIDAGTGRTATYMNVPPGRYIFRVKAASSDGTWSKDDATIGLIIRPAFWQTWWFRLLMVSLMAALLYTAYRYRVRHLLHVQQMRLRIAADLHDDIGAGLGSIALMSDMLGRRDELGEWDRRQIGEIGEAAREMAADLREIVWFISPERDRLGDLVTRLQQETPRLLGPLSYTFHGPEVESEQVLDMAYRRNVVLIYKEMLHNVTRHAQATHVAIHITQQNGSLRVRVADDGVGCNGTQGSGNGLANMRRRAEHLGGELAMESSAGAGTTLTLVAPLP